LKLFWKIYVAVFTSFVAVVGAISYGTSAWQISNAENRIVNEHKMIGSFVVGDMERRRTESSWPFENLARLSQYKGFLFWWVVETDGTIRLADRASFIGSSAPRYFSEVTSDPTPEGRVFLNRQKSHGIFVKSFGSGDNKLSFWLGFSTEEVSQAANKIVLSVTTFSALALAVLAVALYLTVEYFTKPIKVLAEGAAIIGNGRLSHRVPVKSSDELGCLAHAFNQMAEHLETTTTSLDSLYHEIAERKRVEDELRCSEERFKTLFEYAPEAYYLHDAQARLLDLNRAAEQLTGYRRDEVIGHSFLDLQILPPPEAPKAQSLLARNTSGLPTGPDEFALNRKDGSQITVEITTLPVTIKGTRVVLGIGRDITRRKKAEEEVRASEERLKVLFECAPDAIYLIDMKGSFVDGNRAAEELTGFCRTELIGVSLAEAGLLSTEQWSKVLANLQKVATGEPTGPDEFNLRRKDGSHVTVETRTFPVKIKGQTLLLGIARDITERRRTEKELRRSEERFRQVAECAGEFIWEVDAEGLYTYANPMVERILGYQPQDIVGKRHFYDFFLPEERDRLKTVALEGFARQESFSGFINSNVHRDGHVVILETSAMPVVDDQGNLTRYRGADTDVTERALAQERLRQQTELLKNVISNIPHFVFWKDCNSVYLGCNEVFAKSTGIENPEDIVGKTDYDLVWKKNADAYRRDDRRVMESGEPLLNFEEPQTREDGRQITLLTSKVPLRDASGSVVGILGIYADITERKQAESRLAYLASFPERNPNPIMEVELDGTIHYMNPAAGDLFPDLPERGPAHAWLADWATVVRPFREGQADTCARDVTIDGRSYEQLLHYLAPNRLIRIYGTDITDRTLAEKRQAQLLQQLGEINQELKDFAHIVSHDLKAPLRAIRVMADWLCTDYADKLDDQGKEYLTLLTGRVDRMQGLIDGVLQYSRVGRTEEGTLPVHLEQLLPEIVENLGVPEHIAVHIAPDLPTLEADPTRITQVFQNLLSNAIKYMDKPQGNIAVACVEQDAFWKFSVCDNGPGIEQKYFERIFKLFQTLTPRDNQESTGVGLTITRKIVEMYGGKIWVESEVGRGSTFFFTFPTKKETQVPVCLGAEVSCGQADALPREE
jgi:PAS domain S-box-containing protein